MLEHPSFRPKVSKGIVFTGLQVTSGLKVYHTGRGPLAGQEDTFPEPDNRSKMRRSVENAAQVGMYQMVAYLYNQLKFVLKVYSRLAPVSTSVTSNDVVARNLTGGRGLLKLKTHHNSTTISAVCHTLWML